MRATREAGGDEMKAIGLTEFGGPEVLKIVELPEPQPGRGEVRIKVHAVAVNPTDITFRSGGRAAQLAERPPPCVPGVDVAGIVDLLGPGTGDRLSVICPATRDRRFGVNHVLLLAIERDRRPGGSSAVRACLYVSLPCGKGTD